MPKEQIIQNLLALFFYMFHLAIVVFYIIYGIIHFKELKRYLKPGLFIGILVLLLIMPGMVFNIVHYDHLSRIEKNHNLQLPPEYFAFIMITIAVLFATVIQLVRTGWHAGLYALAKSEWQKLRRPLYDPNQKQSLFNSHMIAAFFFGIFAGAISTLIFEILNVGESQYLLKMRDLYPGMEFTSRYIKFAVILLAVTGVAISEEIIFRGAVLAVLIRQCKTKIGIILAIALISLIWGGLHMLNTDAPLIKITQVFLLGFFFAEFTRRGSIESSIAAHIGLNLSCVVIALLTNSLP
ncbi:MAG: CPBP family intramembrane metalloprotease [Candidatus Omnitrophica bacterium]|nr:CPBP family intramembrane metalloprotease [Candidatus Omnitrophota bacterium]